MKNLYSFYWDCGRQGEVNGVFLATEEEVNNVIGKEIYFGEILGKHSEIYGKLEKNEIKIITDNQDFLKMAEDLKIDLSSGFNPLAYIQEEE